MWWEKITLLFNIKSHIIKQAFEIIDQVKFHKGYKCSCGKKKIL